MSGKPKGGRQKTPGGLDKVLFIRISTAMLARLEEKRARLSKKLGVPLSAADVIRSYIEKGE